MKEYWKKIYKTRYFWSHLAKNDLKTRFRRSKLGLLWTIIQPHFLTIIMSVVFGVVFQQPLGEYSIYILSGIIVWDMLQTCIVSGGSALFNSEQYIRQFNHPITIYTLRHAVVVSAIFCMEMIALAVWGVFYSPINLLFGCLTLPLTILLFFPLVWGFSTIAGYSGTKYRDYPQIMALIMQILYYISPVFFKQEMFMSNQILKLWFELNPITHFLNLVRAPFVYAEFPTVMDYIFVLFTNFAVVLWAFLLNRKNEKTIIFYL